MLSDSFFFQAEDGIRDYKVTGVQTCALPIFQRVAHVVLFGEARGRHAGPCGRPRRRPRGLSAGGPRSEERREGKSVDLGGRRIIKKKKAKGQGSLLPPAVERA